MTKCCLLVQRWRRFARGSAVGSGVMACETRVSRLFRCSTSSGHSSSRTSSVAFAVASMVSMSCWTVSNTLKAPRWISSHLCSSVSRYQVRSACPVRPNAKGMCGMARCAARSNSRRALSRLAGSWSRKRLRTNWSASRAGRQCAPPRLGTLAAREPCRRHVGRRPSGSRSVSRSWAHQCSRSRPVSHAATLRVVSSMRYRCGCRRGLVRVSSIRRGPFWYRKYVLTSGAEP